MPVPMTTTTNDVLCVCSVLLDSVSGQRERGEGRGGEGRKEKKSGCFISIDTIIMMTVCNRMFFTYMTAAVRKRKKQDEAMNIYMQRKATTHGADFLFSLFSFLINGVPPFHLMFSKWIYWPLGKNFASSPLLAKEILSPF